MNEDLFLESVVGPLATQCLEKQSALLSGFVTALPGKPSDANPETAFFATLQSMWENEEIEYLGDPMAHLQIPIFDSFDVATRKAVAVLDSLINWRYFFRNLLAPNVEGITLVLENACDGVFTFEISKGEVDFVGAGDRHEGKYQGYKRSTSFNVSTIDDGSETGIVFDQTQCPYSLSVYPSQQYYNTFVGGQAALTSFAVAMVFIFTMCMFLVYDHVVEIRQRLVLAHATQSTAIVSSLFPKNVRDRLMQPHKNDKKGNNQHAMVPNHRLKTFLSGGETNEGQPIADLFLNCTVFFADIAGFTAWSSTREPAQVFVLLQTVYQAFDTLAKRRKVFKVETIGDAYVAVTGLPEAQVSRSSDGKCTPFCLLG